MNRIFLSVIFIQIFPAVFFAQQNKLPVWKQQNENLQTTDWLISNTINKAEIYASADTKDIILSNGLLKRVFRISPNAVCTEFKNMSSGQQLLRAVKPEATISINGVNYNIGGLHGQKENAYLLPQWLDGFTAGKNDFQFTGFRVDSITPFLKWKNKTWTLNKEQAKGKMLSLSFAAPASMGADINVTVHYELYDNLPLVVKWLSVKNNSNKTIVIDKCVNEILAVVEEESAVVGSVQKMKPQHGIYIETNYAFNNAMRYDISDQTTHWKADSSYTSQVNYDYQTPCLLEVYADKVKSVELQPGETFQSVRTHELLMDSYDRERRGMMIRNMYRVIAPWTSQNPIFMHLVSRNDQQVTEAIDQCAATGYEALILSFGSHCNMEDTSASNMAKWKTLTDYAHSKGILIGSYSLFSSRKISDEDDVISPVTGKPGGAFFGNAPCMGSRWGLGYLQTIKTFIQTTGFDIFENDGPYPGDVCASTKHPGHKGLDDSQWKQMQLQKSLYHWCLANGVYVNAPDWYFLDGTHKIGLGYREVNFSLPRENQKILNRQNIYDGLWEKTPSMGWGFVPLTKYQGGGAEAVLEPLSEHLKDYEQLMMQYYGAGVQACYRGPRLYDTEETRKVVARVIDWYKTNREILNADIIHLRRADGRDWDGWMHVNPKLKTKAMVMLFNPLPTEMVRTIKLPLYYSGIAQKAIIKEQGKNAKTVAVNQKQEINLSVTIPAGWFRWIEVEALR